MTSAASTQSGGTQGLNATNPKPVAGQRLGDDLHNEGQNDDMQQLNSAPPKFSPEEEASLLEESVGHKVIANQLFTSAKYEEAISKYEEAVAVCPHYLDYELAVLRSNISACHLKLEQWKEAIKSATDSLDGLGRLERTSQEGAGNGEGKSPEKEQASTNTTGGHKETDDDIEEEIVSSGAQRSAPAAEELDSQSQAEEEARRKRKDDIQRIRAKSLMRRARARSELGGWSNLSGAEEDYKTLSTMANLSPADRKIVQAQLRSLPPRTKAAQEKEMAEMWGKLKGLGNGLLKPFGLSTDNFNMVKDEKTGGYSMSFSQNPPS